MDNSKLTIGENDFSPGIGSSSHTGMQLVQNLDILNIDGIAQAGFETINTFPDSTTTTFTADQTTEQLTVASTFQWAREGITFSAAARAVTVSSTVSLPTGLTATTNYYIIEISSTVIKLASTFANAVAGTPINLTSNGSGTMTITSVNPRRFEHYALDTNNPGAESAGGATVYAQDKVGRIWFYSITYGWVLLDGNSTAGGGGAGYGLAIWKNYLFSFQATSVDLYGRLSDVTPTWTNTWAGESAGSPLIQGNAPDNRNLHTTIIGQDNILYFANVDNTTSSLPWVGSLLEVPGQVFAPANAATYTWNGHALDLPNGYFITDFDELGLNLMISTISDKIYAWDRISPSFNFPIIAAEQNVSCLKTMNNMLYYSAGFRGNIYRTLGTTSELVKDYSDQLSNVPQNVMLIVDMQVYRGYLMFTATGMTPGLYLLDVNNGNRYTLYNTCSNTSGIPGAIFTGFDPFISSLNYICYRYFFSWSTSIDDNSGSRGCDCNFFKTNGPWRATGDIAYFISKQYRTNTDERPFTFGTVSLYLSDPIPSTHSVILQYRTDNSTAFSSSFQTVFTSSLMSSSGGVSATLNVNVENSRVFQCKAILSLPINVSGTSQYTSPKLKEVTFN